MKMSMPESSRRIALLVFFLLVACGERFDVQIIEGTVQTVSYEETIHINNCGGKANSQQTAARSFTSSIEGGVEIRAGNSVIEGSILAKYGQYRNIVKSQTLTAPPGTDMEIILRWSEEVHAGNVTVNGKSGNYSVRVPVSVEQVSSRDLICDQQNNNSSKTPSMPNPSASGFTQYDLDVVLGRGNWRCFPDRLDGVSFLNVPNNFSVRYPIANVDKQGIKYQEGENVPSGGLATAWLEGQLASNAECPNQ